MLTLRISVAVAALATVPGVARAQEGWVGIGAIAGTAMFMDTTGIVRSASNVTVWIRSVDREPRRFVVGRDTITFDTVIALNRFDCGHATRTVATVRYLFGSTVVLDIADTRDSPEAVRPGSFFGAVMADLCRSER